MPIFNKYSKPCDSCGEIVPPKQGALIRKNGNWLVRHVKCEAPRIHIIEFSGGDIMHQNTNGRCEDAPCCGCCD